jgi:hypothetical protein
MHIHIAQGQFRVDLFANIFIMCSSLLYNFSSTKITILILIKKRKNRRIDATVQRVLKMYIITFIFFLSLDFEILSKKLIIDSGEVDESAESCDISFK